jgi:hypothetical protein
MLAAAVVRKLGPAAYGELVPRLVAAAREGPLQAEVSLLVLQFVSEDLTQFEEAVGAGGAPRFVFVFRFPSFFFCFPSFFGGGVESPSLAFVRTSPPCALAPFSFPARPLGLALRALAPF